MRRRVHLQDLSPNRGENHQARVLSKDKVQKAHHREHPRNRVQVLLDRGQSKAKDPLSRDQDKVRDPQARGPNQVRVLLAKDPLGRGPGKVRDPQAKG